MRGASLSHCGGSTSTTLPTVDGSAGHGKTKPGARRGRPVREARRRPRDPDAATRREPGAGEPRRAALSPRMVGLRFQAAARADGVEHVTAHSGRVGLASELTRRGRVSPRFETVR